MKLIGTSGYGSLIMDKTKHRAVKYIQGENETCLKVNDPLFQKLECLDEEEQIYEVEMAKRKHRALDLSIQLGYFILQYAKVRMLEFYFDFMDVYVDRSDFEHCEMDTDSAQGQGNFWFQLRGHHQTGDENKISARIEWLLY